MSLFSLKHSMGLSESQKKHYNKDIEHFQKKVLEAKEPEKEFHKLSKIVNSVISHGLDLHYKFTYEDLKLEIIEKNLPDDVETKAEDLCNMLNELEFSKDKITNEKLVEVSRLLLELVNMLTGVKVEDKKLESEEDDFKKIPVEPAKLDVKEKKPEVKFEKLEKKGLFSGLLKKKDKKAEPEELPEFKFKPKKPEIKKDKEPELMENKDVVEVKEPDDFTVALKEEPEDNLIKESKKDKLEESFTVSHEKKAKLKPEKVRAKVKKIKKQKVAKKIKKLPLSKITKKAKPVKKKEEDLHEVIKQLKQEKRQIEKEIALVDKEEHVLKDEKKIIEKRDSIRPLPEFKIFKQELGRDIDELEKKKDVLKSKEKEADSRLKTISIMEKKLKELSKKLGKDEIMLKKEKDLIKTKEKLIREIKKDLGKKYNEAVKEIEKIKFDLKDKKSNFLKLQKFYQARENRLSHEEANLLTEKRQYTKLVSGLLNKHFGIAKSDLENTGHKIQELKNKNKEAEKQLKGYEKKFRDLVREKDRIKKDISDKKNYFSTVESEFKEKDPEFEKLNVLLNKKNELNIEKESVLLELKTKIEKADAELKSNIQGLDLKELDLKTVQKDMERLTFDLSNNRNRLEIRQKQLEKRISSYKMLKDDISRNIGREKRAITTIEKKLHGESYHVDKKIDEANMLEEGFDAKKKEHKSLFDMAHALELEEEIHLKEINVSHHFPETTLGNPAILDILRLLNMARNFINNDKKGRARDTYLEVQRVFDGLDEENKEDIYTEILKVFRPKDNINVYSNQPEDVLASHDINSLIQNFDSAISLGDLAAAEKIYGKLQLKYARLSKEDRTKYYESIMQLYNKILDQEVTSGIIT